MTKCLAESGAVSPAAKQARGTLWGEAVAKAGGHPGDAQRACAGDGQLGGHTEGNQQETPTAMLSSVRSASAVAFAIDDRRAMLRATLARAIEGTGWVGGRGRGRGGGRDGGGGRAAEGALGRAARELLDRHFNNDNT